MNYYNPFKRYLIGNLDGAKKDNISKAVSFISLRWNFLNHYIQFNFAKFISRSCLSHFKRFPFHTEGEDHGPVSWQK